MEVFFNADSSFFDITSDSLKGDKSVSKLINKDVISFSVSEEIGKLTSGTLQLRDQSHKYSKIFREGHVFNIQWGYKKFGASLGSQQRTGFKAFIQTPSGNGNEQGVIGYNVTFYAMEFLEGRKTRIHSQGSRFSLIQQLMNEIGVSDTLIDFQDQHIKLSTETQVQQRETSYKLLSILAGKWKTNFQIGFKPDGKSIGLFVDPKKMDSFLVKSFLTKSIGTIVKGPKELFFNAGKQSNVLSYTWKKHIGESGQGDGTLITLINGKPVFTNVVLQTETVLTYKLNEDKIRAEFEKQDSVFDKTNLLVELLDKNDFDQVKHFFDVVPQETAPQGMGYTIECNMHGDPFLTVPFDIIFKEGFPAPLTQNQVDPISKRINFFLQKSTHTFNKASGYNTSITVVDSYSATGSAIAPRTNII